MRAELMWTYHSNSPADTKVTPERSFHSALLYFVTCVWCVCVHTHYQADTNVFLIPGHSGLLEHGAAECKQSLINTARICNLAQ